MPVSYPREETHELYSDQLRALGLGHAMYEPEPNEGENEVQIGDIGYIKYGRFMRFASVFTLEHGIPTVEEKFRAITKLARLDKGVMSSRSVQSERMEAEISARESTSGASIGVCLKLTCCSDRGASLITRHQSTNLKAKFPNVLEEHFISHLMSYKDIANRERLPIKNLHDIVLVTGRVMTGDWATIAFRDITEESNASFDIKAATITASGSKWGKWSEHVSFPKRHGPIRQQPFSDAEEPPEDALDQCIFITPFRISDLAWYKRLRFLPFLSQKSSPSSSPMESPATSSDTSRKDTSTGGAPHTTRQKNADFDSVSESRIYETDEFLTAYEVLAFHAFQKLESSGLEFEFLCISEEDMKLYKPRACLLKDLQGPAMDFNVVNFFPYSDAKVGRLQQRPEPLDNFEGDQLFVDVSTPSVGSTPPSPSPSQTSEDMPSYSLPVPRTVIAGNGAPTSPQQSRNSRAQARHRAKRKAYIEQLEETVTKLQHFLHITPEQVAQLPPLSQRVRELEREVKGLREENDRLRRYTSSHAPALASETMASMHDNDERSEQGQTYKLFEARGPFSISIPSNSLPSPSIFAPYSLPNFRSKRESRPRSDSPSSPSYSQYSMPTGSSLAESSSTHASHTSTKKRGSSLSDHEEMTIAQKIRWG